MSIFRIGRRLRSQRGLASLIALYAISVLLDWGTSALFTLMRFGECEGNSIVRAFFEKPTLENFWLLAGNQLYLPVANTWQDWISFAFLTMLPLGASVALIAIRLRPSFAQWSKVSLGFVSRFLQQIFLVVIVILISIRFLLGAASNIATIISVSLWAQCLTGNGALLLFTICGIALAIFCLLFLEQLNR